MHPWISHQRVLLCYMCVCVCVWTMKPGGWGGGVSVFGWFMFILVLVLFSFLHSCSSRFSLHHRSNKYSIFFLLLFQIWSECNIHTNQHRSRSRRKLFSHLRGAPLADSDVFYREQLIQINKSRHCFTYAHERTFNSDGMLVVEDFRHDVPCRKRRGHLGQNMKIAAAAHKQTLSRPRKNILLS